jgi:hypothetical protein
VLFRLLELKHWLVLLGKRSLATAVKRRRGACPASSCRGKCNALLQFGKPCALPSLFMNSNLRGQFGLQDFNVFMLFVRLGIFERFGI